MKFELDSFLRLVKKIIPKKIFKTLQPIYHWLMAFLSAVIYHFPSRKIFVIGVTGTKGKTTTIELINAIFEEAGFKTGIISSLRFKISKESKRNELKMTMPGRFFIQSFLRKAVREKCQYAIIEMTSEGAVLYRHKFIDINALIFTNLSPEHIESHGSFEKYREAKLKLFKALGSDTRFWRGQSSDPEGRRKKIAIINEDDQNASHFLNSVSNGVQKIKYSIQNLESYSLKKDGVDFKINGVNISSNLYGEFNLYNILAAITFAKSQNIKMSIIKSAIEKFQGVEGRMEKINEGQDFEIVVDYAHTPDSLEKVYETFKGIRKICVLGSAGGGRDRWKREEMGKIALKYCEQIIVTNEDPYDEDPQKIIEDVIKKIPYGRCEVIIDRREAIRKTLASAQKGDVVIITGKGAEPWIMGPKGTKILWDDRQVVREELKRLIK